jgi:ATP-binding protein involved in chromosome partitioning
LLPGVKNVIAVGAGKGGVGKSTVAVHLAVGLQNRGLAVGLLDCDVYGPSIARMLDIEDLTPPELVDDKIPPFRAHGLEIMTIANFVPPGQAMIWRGPMINSAVLQFLRDVSWGELDYLVVDLPPGTGDAPLTLAQHVGVTGAVIVATPQPVALADAIRAAAMYQQLGIYVLGMVENMSYFVCPDCQAEHDIFGRGGARAAALEAGLPLLGELPLNVTVRRNTDSGKALEDFDPAVAGPAVAAALASMVDNVVKAVTLRNETLPPARPLRVGGGHEHGHDHGGGCDCGGH